MILSGMHKLVTFTKFFVLRIFSKAGAESTCGSDLSTKCCTDSFSSLMGEKHLFDCKNNLNMSMEFKYVTEKYYNS